MRDNTWVIWLVMFVASLVLEGIARQLFSACFAAGALAALLSCAFGAPAWAQALVFVLITAACLAASRPLVKRLQQKTLPPEEEAAPKENTAPEEEATP